MDTKKIGLFLAQLRKEQGLTQEQLGEKLGVTNKTVSRWETGTYLPPVECLQLLSSLYSITINEILSGERLAGKAFKEKAEENITTVLKQRAFSGRERLEACVEWLTRYWWVILLCLLPSAVMYALRPFVIGDSGNVGALTISFLLLGINIIVDHVMFYVSGRAWSVTRRREEYRPFQILRIFWLVTAGVTMFVTIDLLGAFFYALTPAGTADGYAVNSLFYDVLIQDHGVYLDNCYAAVKRILWHLFGICVINIDLAVLWIRRK